MLLSVLAPRPLPCASTSTNEKPPPGRSITSSVSPLSTEPCRGILAAATCIVSIAPLQLSEVLVPIVGLAPRGGKIAADFTDTTKRLSGRYHLGLTLF